MRNVLQWIGVVALVAASIFLAATISGDRNYRKGFYDALASIKPDTEYVDKPVYIDNPVPVVVFRDTGRVVYIPVIVKDSTGHADTTAAPMHPEIKQYEDSTYRAQVSGIYPNLDWIEVHQKTTYITKEVQVPGPAPRWSFGVTAGPGILWEGWDGKIHGGIGIVAGLQYRF